MVTVINGTELSDVQHGSLAFYRLRANAIANVTVVRDGVAQILTLDASLVGEVVRDP